MASAKPTIVTNCDICEARVAASIEESYETYIDAANYSIRYLLLRCPECDTGILAQQDNEHAQSCPADAGPHWANLTRLYPHSDNGKLGAAVPDAINRAFSEAYACWKSKAYAACALMCATILKGVCKSYGAVGCDLVRCLKNLCDRGELDRRFYDWSTALKLTGNEAEFEANMSMEDASDLLDFAEAIVEYTYTFKAKFSSFEMRRAKRASPSEGSVSARLEALISL
jgi:hypothetical protein